METLNSAAGRIVESLQICQSALEFNEMEVGGPIEPLSASQLSSLFLINLLMMIANLPNRINLVLSLAWLNKVLFCSGRQNRWKHPGTNFIPGECFHCCLLWTEQ